jgi:hypothetical protein
MLSMRWNLFRVCSACVKIVSAYAQHTHATNFEKWLKKPWLKCKFRLWKIQILKNRLGTYLTGPKWRLWRKKIFGYLSKKILFGVCSVTTEMFDHRNSGENQRKRSKMFSKIYEGHIRIWFRLKKNSKLSHACVSLTVHPSVSMQCTLTVH